MQRCSLDIKTHSDFLIQPYNYNFITCVAELIFWQVVDLKRKWLYGVSRSPSGSPSLSSSPTSSPSFSSPPYPGSPLLSRKLPGFRPDSPPSPCTVDSVLQAEIDKLQRWEMKWFCYSILTQITLPWSASKDLKILSCGCQVWVCLDSIPSFLSQTISYHLKMVVKWLLRYSESMCKI